MEWTYDVLEKVRAWWADGETTSEIGRRLGVSKNAIVGKAHRIGLPARPSPIRRRTPITDKAVRASIPRPGPLPVLPSLMAATPCTDPPPTLTDGETNFRPRRCGQCQYPLGDPGTRSFRFCDQETLPGKPYCAMHATRCFLPVVERRDHASLHAGDD